MIHRLLAAVGTIGIVALQGTPAPSRPTPTYRIVGLRAQLFYVDRGSFSDDVLARDEPGLRNTIIGGGLSGGPSNETLVVVEVEGPPGAFDATRRVELAVRASGREIFRRRQTVQVLNAQGRSFVGFWLYDTGCEVLQISTALLGQSDPSRRAARIPFSCGE